MFASSGHKPLSRLASKCSIPVGELIFASAAVGATSNAQCDIAATSVAMIFETTIGEGVVGADASGLNTNIHAGGTGGLFCPGASKLNVPSDSAFSLRRQRESEISW